MPRDYKPVSSSPHAVSLTRRDLAMLGDLARYRVLTAAQLRREHFPTGVVATVVNRLCKLRAAGYVTRATLGYGQGAVWVLTPKGAVSSETGLPAPRGTAASWPAQWYRHHLTVADVAAALLAKAATVGVGATWQTEAEWCREQRPWPVGSSRPDGVLSLTAEDGVEHRLAVEVELHPKPDRAYAAKLRWYRQQLAAGAFERVRWYCGDELTLRHVQQHAGAGPQVETRTLASLLAASETVAA